MADPEQIYAEVLSEEQGKGVSPPVAEGRAKAARARAETGSPHPKEPKWWPGSQPHLEGGEGAAPAAEAEAAPEEAGTETVEAAAQDEPAAAPVAEETPAVADEQQAPQVPQEQAPAPAEPVQPAAATAAAPPEATAAPAAAAAAEPEQKPSGVIHGTTTGTRVRPEDAATTEAQYAGQQAMYDRRKLIDELVGTGVPVVSASDTGEKRSPALALMYLLIPILAIAFLLAQDDSAPAEGGPPEDGPETGAVVMVAENIQFDTDQISLTADEESTITLDNQDSVAHNLSIYEDDSAEEDLFVGQEIGGGSSIDYSVPPIEAGEYFFRCDLHPTSMVGTVSVE